MSECVESALRWSLIGRETPESTFDTRPRRPVARPFAREREMTRGEQQRLARLAEQAFREVVRLERGISAGFDLSDDLQRARDQLRAYEWRLANG